MEAITKEQAIEEVNSWLDFKKVGEGKRELQKDSIKVLINAIEDGSLYLKDDKTFVHILKFPFGEDVKTTQFEYKPRLNGLETEKAQKGVKGEGFQLLIAMASALTGKAPGLLKHMDSEDLAISQAISVFFL